MHLSRIGNQVVSRRGPARARRVTVGLILPLLLTACSVSTPRDGLVASSAGVAGDRAAASSAGSEPDVASLDADATSAGVSSRSTSGAAARAGATSAGGKGPASSAPAAGGPTAAGSTVGLTNDSMVVSVMAGYSGPYGALLKAIAEGGYGLWADEVNAQGGIHGRKITVKLVDNRDSAEGGVAACKEIQGNGSFLGIILAGLGGADMSASECLDRAGIPVFASNLAGFRAKWRYVVSFFDDAAQARPLASFIKNAIGDANGKVGIIMYNDPIGFAARDGVKPELARLGLQLVREEIFAPGQGSFVAELSRLRSAGATTVVIFSGNESIGIVRDAKAMGYSPNFTGVLWTLDEFSQAGAQLWNGIKAIRGWPTTNAPAYKSYTAKAKQYGRDALVNTTVMAVYGSGLLLGEILTKSGRSVTRESIGPAAEQITNYNNGILGLSFGPGVRVAKLAMFPIVCCNPDNTWKGTGDARVEF